MTSQEQTDVAVPTAFDEVKTFLAVMAMALRDMVLRFEDSTARVTELAMMRAGRPDRDLVVALQSYDRLQQEFATLADVFALAAAKPHETWLRTEGNGHPAEDTIAKIPIADLKERLLRHLGDAVSDLAQSPMCEEVVF